MEINRGSTSEYPSGRQADPGSSTRDFLEKFLTLTCEKASVSLAREAPVKFRVTQIGDDSIRCSLVAAESCASARLLNKGQRFARVPPRGSDGRSESQTSQKLEIGVYEIFP